MGVYKKCVIWFKFLSSKALDMYETQWMPRKHSITISLPRFFPPHYPHIIFYL